MRRRFHFLIVFVPLFLCFGVYEANAQYGEDDSDDDFWEDYDDAYELDEFTGYPDDSGGGDGDHGNGDDGWEDDGWDDDPWDDVFEGEYDDDNGDEGDGGGGSSGGSDGSGSDNGGGNGDDNENSSEHQFLSENAGFFRENNYPDQFYIPAIVVPIIPVELVLTTATIAPIEVIIVGSVSPTELAAAVSAYNAANPGTTVQTSTVATENLAKFETDTPLSPAIEDFNRWLQEYIIDNIDPADEGMEIARFEDCLSNDECKCTTEADCGIKKWYLDRDGDGYHAKGSDPKEQVESPGEDWVEGVSGGEDCDDYDADVRDECNDCTDITCEENEELNEDKCECIPSNCEYKTGYLHEGAFTNKTAPIGENTVKTTDNFRNESGAIIDNTNCKSGKIEAGSEVNVTGPKEERNYIKSDGTTAKSNYYPIEYLDCPKGNRPGNPNYDSDKPCSDCFKGNPVKGDKQIAKQTASGITGGTYGDTRKKWKVTKDPTTGKVTKKLVPKNHGGVDIKSEFGDPIYAMFDGTATLKTQKDKDGEVTGAGHYVQIISKVDGKTIKTWYFHMQKDNRTSGEVKAGDIIGYQGKSGNLGEALEDKVTESHVHIQLYENGVKKNPVDYFKASLDTTTGKFTNDSDCK